jgi:hypothetical protein
VHHGGLGLVEYTRHAVTVRDNKIHVNLLVPGLYYVELPGGRKAEVRITTPYPARAEASILAAGVPADISLRLRVPGCVKQPVTRESRDGDRVQITLSGRLGHHVEHCNGGDMLKYGPLVLAPAIYSWQGSDAGVNIAAASEAYVPTGYIPEVMPRGLPVLELPTPDADGLLSLSDLPRPVWMYFDEGQTAPCSVDGAAANVSVKFRDGEQKALRFTPMCYNTSCLSLFDTPIVFSAAEHLQT